MYIMHLDLKDVQYCPVPQKCGAGQSDHLLQPLTFQSMVEKKACRLISSTPSGPAPTEDNKIKETKRNFNLS